MAGPQKAIEIETLPQFWPNHSLLIPGQAFWDETAAACDLVIPSLHALERWDDSRPRAGVRGLLQPVMEPVFRNMATGDVLLQAARKIGAESSGCERLLEVRACVASVSFQVACSSSRIDHEGRETNRFRG